MFGHKLSRSVCVFFTLLNVCVTVHKIARPTLSGCKFKWDKLADKKLPIVILKQVSNQTRTESEK